MIADIRTFIIAAVKDCSTLYISTDKPFFDSADLVETNADYTYHIEMGTAVPEIADDGVSIYNVPATLRTYRQGGREKLESFDQGYDQALRIAALVVDNSSLTDTSYVIGVSGGDVSPAEVLDSQDVYEYSTSFTFKVGSILGE